MSYTVIDQALKSESITARIRMSVLRWSFNRLADPDRIIDQDAVAKLVLRGDKRLADIIIRAIVINPGVDVGILEDTPTGDELIDDAVETLIPAALSLGLIKVDDPDGEE